MQRRDFIKFSAGAALLANPVKRSLSGRGPAGIPVENSIPTRVTSVRPPLRWEDAMISGNGSTGIMVMGLPLNDRIIVNHEKL